MKKNFILIIAGLFMVTASQAQVSGIADVKETGSKVKTLQTSEFKLAKSTGKLVINLGSVKVEGYSGNEIVFSNTKMDRDDDERAKGLRPIDGSGLEDNTGVGINVTEKGNTYEVNQVGTDDRSITIKVPKGVSVSYTFSKAVGAGKAVFKNLESELEVSVQYNSIELENVTGPLTVKAVYGGVDAKFADNIKGPLSIVSIYGHVDVAIPAATKASLKMNTSHGQIFAAADLKLDLEKNTNSDMVNFNNNNVRGKINGGGIDFTLRSDYGKIYLRKSSN